MPSNRELDVAMIDRQEVIDLLNILRPIRDETIWEYARGIDDTITNAIDLINLLDTKSVSEVTGPQFCDAFFNDNAMGGCSCRSAISRAT